MRPSRISAAVGTLVLAAALTSLTGGVARAAAPVPTALILAPTVSPGTATDGSGKSLEQQQAEAAGFTVTVVDDATWRGMTAAQFASYQVLVLGDPTCGTADSFQAAIDTASTWEPVVMSSDGNRVLIGTDPTYHNGGHPGAATLEKNGIAFAGYHAGQTGAYVDLSCAYTGIDESVGWLDGLTTKAADAFHATGAPCAGAIAIIAASGPTAGLHDTDLSDWSCSVHEYFSKFPSDYIPLALATDAPTKNYEGKDVDTGASVTGSPYILVAGSPLSIGSSDISLTPATGSDPVGGSHTVTATVTSSGVPQPGFSVTFNVTGGPNAGRTGASTTSSTGCSASPPVAPCGTTSFTYSDTGGAGTDTIIATFTDTGGVTHSASASETWSATAPVDTTPPTCTVTRHTGNPVTADAALSDAGSGIVKIVVTKVVNASYAVDGGTSKTVLSTTTYPVAVHSAALHAVKLVQTKSSNVSLTITDAAGNATSC